MRYTHKGNGLKACINVLTIGAGFSGGKDSKKCAINDQFFYNDDRRAEMKGLRSSPCCCLLCDADAFQQN